ncbi:hypothetical protein EE612_042313, partial [Oryza sativa]
MASTGVKLIGEGIYHGKQCHAADIPAVIARAWAAGVDRIIVTGGSLKESREVLEIAETDGELSCLDAGCFDYVMLGAFKVFVVMCPRSCDVLGRCREAVLHGGRAPDEMWGRGGLCIIPVSLLASEIGTCLSRLVYVISALLNARSLRRVEIRKGISRRCWLWRRKESRKARFPGGVTHSFTGTAEDRDKLLSFEDVYR